MKFGKELFRSMLPKWRLRYVSYKHLKRLIKDMHRIQEEHNDNEPLYITEQAKPNAFYRTLLLELVKIDEFFNRKLHYLQTRQRDLFAKLDDLVPMKAQTADAAQASVDQSWASLPAYLSLVKALDWFTKEIDELIKFCKINHKALVKISKKFVKRVSLADEFVRLDTYSDVAANKKFKTTWDSLLLDQPFVRAAQPEGVLSVMAKDAADRLAALNQGHDAQSHVIGRLLSQVEFKESLSSAQLQASAKDMEKLLHFAVRMRDLNAVSAVLPRVRDIDAIDDQDCTVLQIAAGNCMPDLVDLLLDHKANVNVQNHMLHSALHVACIRGHVTCVDRLLKRDADASLEDQELRTAFHLAAFHNQVDSMARLVEVVPELIDNQDASGNTALAIACVEGYPELVDLLIGAGADTASRNWKGSTALHLAARKGTAAAVKSLLEAGCPLASFDLEGRSPLNEAAAQGHAECLKIMLAYEKLHPHTKVVQTDITTVRTTSPLPMAHMQRPASASPSAWTSADDLGPPPLLGSSSAGSNSSGGTVHKSHRVRVNRIHDLFSLCDIPLSLGVLLGTETKDEATELKVKSDMGRATPPSLKLAELPLYDHQDIEGWTPLHDAAQGGHVDCTRVLLAAGCDPHMVDRFAWPARVYAIYNGHLQLATKLLPKLTAEQEAKLQRSSGKAKSRRKPSILPLPPMPQKTLPSVAPTQIAPIRQSLSAMSPAEWRVSDDSPRYHHRVGSVTSLYKTALTTGASATTDDIAAEAADEEKAGHMHGLVRLSNDYSSPFVPSLRAMAGGDIFPQFNLTPRDASSAPLELKKEPTRTIVGYCKVEFRVRANTDKDEYLCIIGDSPALGSWDPQKGLRMKKRKSPQSGLSTSRPHGSNSTSVSLDSGQDKAGVSQESTAWVAKAVLPVYATGGSTHSSVSPSPQSRSDIDMIPTGNLLSVSSLEHGGKRRGTGVGTAHHVSVAGTHTAANRYLASAGDVPRHDRQRQRILNQQSPSPSPARSRKNSDAAPVCDVAYKYIVKHRDAGRLLEWEALPSNRVVTIEANDEVIVVDGRFGIQLPDKSTTTPSSAASADSSNEASPPSSQPSSAAPTPSLPEAKKDLWVDEGFLIDQLELQVMLGHRTISPKKPLLHLFKESRYMRAHRIILRCGELQWQGSDWVEAKRYVATMPIASPNKVYTFHSPYSSEDPSVAAAKLFLQFEVYPKVGPAFARGYILPTQLLERRKGAATIPLVSPKSHLVMGELNFEFLLIKPFLHPRMNNVLARSFSKSVRIIGHRGAGSNKAAMSGLYRRTHVAENTILSFVTAGTLGAHYVEFDVQLTADDVPVIYHNFYIPVGNIEVPIHQLTYKDILAMRKPQQCTQRRHSVSDIRDLRRWRDQSQEESISAPITDFVSTLEETMLLVPLETGFNIEIKYPYGNKQLQNVAERNHYVDTILKTVFDHAGDRSIIFSTFDADVAIMLALKQPSYPVFFLTEAGTVAPMADFRRNSLNAAIEFATASGLLGIVTEVSPLVEAPEIVRAVKSAGLLLASYGQQNNNTEVVEMQKRYGVDSVIVDHVAHVAKYLTSSTASAQS